MSNENILFDQRVMYHGLVRVNKDRQFLKSAFDHWLKTQSQQPFNVVEIVQNLVDYFGLDTSEKKRLMISLHAASNKLYEDLPEVPTFLLETSSTAPEADQAQVQDTVVKAQAPHLIVTTSYLKQLVQQLKKNDFSFYEELLDILKDEGLPVSKNINEVVSRWSTNGLTDISLNDDFKEADCKELCHQLYLLVCEIAGPNATDNIVNAVISSVANLESSSRFHPRNLI